MDYHSFYRTLFAPLETTLGPLDPETLIAIIGFDAGGPLSFRTVGRHAGGRFITYVSCELAVRKKQKPSDVGRYELLASCDSEQWVRDTLSEVGRMSLTTRFGNGHTLDIGAWVNPADRIQGVVLEKVYATRIGLRTYGVLRCIGITRSEMQFALGHGSAALLEELRRTGSYPHTHVGTRPS